MRIYRPQARAILQVIFEGFGDTARDSPVHIVPVLPKAVTIHRNSYNQADSWDITIDAGDLPIDPELVRAGAVEIYLFQTDATEQRVLSRREPLAEPDAGALRPRDPSDTQALDMGLASSKDRFTLGNRPQIAGLFDQDDLAMDESGRWVTISGQDYTAHLMAEQWPPLPNGRARRIPIGKRLDLLLAELLAEADPEGKLALNVRGLSPSELPIVGKNEARGNRRGIPVDSETSYWDVMYKLATRHGFIIYVDGLDVVLSAPRNLGRADAGRIRRLAWGHNLSSLKLSRKLGKQQSPTILVRGYDAAGRNMVEVEYPRGSYNRASKVGERKAATKTTTRKSKTGKVSTTVRNRDEYEIVPAYGQTDPKVLQQMAETLYQLRGRAERTVLATTRDLRDMRESDMLDVAAGDAVTIEWDDFNRELLRNPDVPRQAKIDHLLGRGFNLELCSAIADAFDKLQGLERPLRVKEATLTYDADDGVDIEIELADFIVIDGIREGQGNRPGAVERGRAGRRGADGETVGWTPEREAAELRRRGL